MVRSFDLDGEVLEYRLRTSRLSKSIKLTAYADGRLAVSRPRWVDLKVVESFIRSKSAWIKNNLPSPAVSYKELSTSRRTDYLLRRETARSFVLERLEYYRRKYGFDYRRVSIRNSVSRWGSCSQSGNLNFNYRILDLPADAAEYLIVHELCHLKEMNHSPAFWRLVEKIIPDYRRLRQILKNI